VNYTAGCLAGGELDGHFVEDRRRGRNTAAAGEKRRASGTDPAKAH